MGVFFAKIAQFFTGAFLPPNFPRSGRRIFGDLGKNRALWCINPGLSGGIMTAFGIAAPEKRRYLDKKRALQNQNTRADSAPPSGYLARAVHSPAFQ